jgi:hypothetical protein
MKFNKYSLFFIHIPRTGGTTLEKILGFRNHYSWKRPDYQNIFGYDKKKKIMLQHATYQQIIKNEYNPQNYKIITIIRNPYYRVMSLYKYVARKESLDKFLNKIEKYLQYDYFYQPQYKYLINEKGEINIDEIVRFENYEEDLKKIKEKYNLDINISFDTNKQLNKKKAIDSVLTEEQKLIIQRIYKKDFELFGYPYS